MLINIATHRLIPERINKCVADRLPFTTSPSHDAIDVFDRSALLELRRAVRLQSVFKTSFSRFDPGSRGQATIISNPSETFFAHAWFGPFGPRSTGAPNDWRRPCGLPKAWGSTTDDQSDKLPTFSGPSFVSGRLGHQRHHWNRLRTSLDLNPTTPGSLQINLLFTIFAEQAALQTK
jgi:hypothetical protein